MDGGKKQTAENAAVAPSVAFIPDRAVGADAERAAITTAPNEHPAAVVLCCGGEEGRMAGIRLLAVKLTTDRDWRALEGRPKRIRRRKSTGDSGTRGGRLENVPKQLERERSDERCMEKVSSARTWRERLVQQHHQSISRTGWRFLAGSRAKEAVKMWCGFAGVETLRRRLEYQCRRGKSARRIRAAHIVGSYAQRVKFVAVAFILETWQRYVLPNNEQWSPKRRTVNCAAASGNPRTGSACISEVRRH